MSSLKLLNDDAILLDNLPAGNLVEFLRAHPARAADYIAALRARVAAESATQIIALQAQLTSAQAALDLLRDEAETARAGLQAELTTAHALAQQRAEALAAADAVRAEMLAELARLRGKYELPDYFQVVALPKPIKGADHAGIRGIIDKQWRGDLLRATGENQYDLVESNGYRAPVDEKVSSLSEVTAAQATADAAKIA